eukprot:16428631-Heterocapsa_arctica.AAC.1
MAAGPRCNAQRVSCRWFSPARWLWLACARRVWHLWPPVLPGTSSRCIERAGPEKIGRTG